MLEINGLGSDQRKHTLTGFLFIYLFTTLFTYSLIYLPNYLFIYLYIYLFTYLIIYLFNDAVSSSQNIIEL